MGCGRSARPISYTEPCGFATSPSETPPLRRPNTTAQVPPHPLGATTVIEMLERAAEHFSDFPCLGTRAVLPGGELGHYEFKTFAHVFRLTTKLADSLGPLIPRNGDGLGIVGIYAVNREEWIITDMACALQGLTTVPLYDTLGVDNIEYIINQTEMTCVAASTKQIPTITSLRKAGKVPSLRHVLHFESLAPADKAEIEQSTGLSLCWYVDLINEGSGSNPKSRPSPKDIYTICYTSGTTGQCKGVVLSHANMVAAVNAAVVEFHFDPTDRYPSYLPLAHVMERIISMVMMSMGVAIGFFAGNVMKLKDDLVALKPTVFVSVPRLFSRLHEAITAQFQAKTGIAARLVTSALASKTRAYQQSQSIHSTLWDSLVFSKVQASIGGKVRLMLSGSAPITPELISFIKIAFACPVLEGYGQTESCGASIATSELDNGCGYLGGPLTGLEIKLVSIPEMRYLVTDRDEQGRPAPRGELCMRGPQIFQGYYKQPDKTAEAIDSEGWLHTGDIAVILPGNGAVKLIDRKKNIFKLAQGEYVAVEKIEGVYSGCPFINQIFVYGDSYKANLVAIIVPNEAYIRKNWAAAHNLDPATPFTDLCTNTALSTDILKDMNRLADLQKVRNTQLNGFERVTKLHLSPVVWTANDLLTPTQKLKRFEAKEHFQAQINQLYAS